MRVVLVAGAASARGTCRGTAPSLPTALAVESSTGTSSAAGAGSGGGLSSALASGSGGSLLASGSLLTTTGVTATGAAEVDLETGGVVFTTVEFPPPLEGLDTRETRGNLEGTVARSVVAGGTTGAESGLTNEGVVGTVGGSVVDLDGTAGEVVGTVVTGGPGQVDGSASAGSGHGVFAGVGKGLTARNSGLSSGTVGVTVTSHVEDLEVTGVTVSNLDKEGVGLSASGESESSESEGSLANHFAM